MNESNNAKNETTTNTNATADIRVDVFGRTDVGLVREHNEDNFLIADLTAGNRNIKPEVREHTVGKNGSIFVVCDGMGGAAAGEVASQIAVDTIYDMMQNGAPPTTEEALAQQLEKAICEAGRRILTAAKINRSQRGMGTTVTAAALFGPRLLVGQVGDSRAYILRGSQFVQITKDQSLVQQLIDAKQMTEEEAKSFDKNNIILQALGTSEEVHVDITSTVLKNGDRLVLCSDGLCGLVENDEIGRIVHDSLNPLEACRVLTENACEAGGYDNITVIVAAFEGESLDPAPAEGKDDDALFYDRYSFSRSEETTARKMRPERPAEAEEGAESKTASERDNTPTEPVSLPENEESVNKTMLGAAGLLVLTIIAILAFLTTQGGNEEEPAPPDPETTSAVAPEQPANAPAPKPSPETPPTPAPTPTPTLPDSVPVMVPAAVSAPPATETSAGEEAIPSLSPTPEEAITKKAPRETKDTPKTPSTDGASTGHATNGTKKTTSSDGTASDETTPSPGGEAQDNNSAPDNEKQPKALKLRSNPYDEADKDAPAKVDTPTKDTDGTKKPTPPPTKGDGNAKPPIDDNPFNGT